MSGQTIFVVRAKAFDIIEVLKLSSLIEIKNKNTK